jgi:hypothetical protein
MGASKSSIASQVPMLSAGAAALPQSFPLPPQSDAPEDKQNQQNDPQKPIDLQTPQRYASSRFSAVSPKKQSSKKIHFILPTSKTATTQPSNSTTAPQRLDLRLKKACSSLSILVRPWARTLAQTA